MEDLIEIKVKDNKPYIILKKELKTFNFGIVTEVANSIHFMMDDPDWIKLPMLDSQPDEIYSVLKIRFLFAVELEDKLRELADKGEITISPAQWSELSHIKRVYKRQVHAGNEDELEGLQEENEPKLYEAAVKYASKAVNTFNMLSMGGNNA